MSGWALGGDASALWLALILDRLLRDPPNALHPVAWMGSVILRAKRLAPTGGRLGPFVWGLLLVATGGTLIALIGFGLQWLFQVALGTFHWIGEAVALRFCLAATGLFAAGSMVQQALQAGDLPTARRLLAFHLVSRPTTDLDQSQVSAATIESLAENTSDSFVAPLLYYGLFGLPGVLLYRFVNTADAMVGYRDARHEWLGKVPARMDDVLNFIPARVTALLVLLAGLMVRCNLGRAFAIWRRDRQVTASPNAGHPMSAAAGVLGIALEKVGCYQLGVGQRRPGADDIQRSIRLLWGVVVLTALLATFLIVTLASAKGTDSS